MSALSVDASITACALPPQSCVDTGCVGRWMMVLAVDVPWHVVLTRRGRSRDRVSMENVCACDEVVRARKCPTSPFPSVACLHKACVYMCACISDLWTSQPTPTSNTNTHPEKKRSARLARCSCRLTEDVKRVRNRHQRRQSLAKKILLATV